MIFKKMCILSLITLISVMAGLEAVDVLAEAKVAYFYPTNHRFRKIYSNGGAIYGVEVSCQTWRGLYAWTSGSFFTKSGSSIGEKDYTRVTLVPLALGLKYLFPVGCSDLYIGAGILSTYLHTHDHSHFVIRNVSIGLHTHDHVYVIRLKHFE